MSTPNRDYEEPAPVAMFEMGELVTWSYYRAVIAEFVATLLFLYIIVAIIIGHKKEEEPCDGVGLLGISWGVGGMIFVLVYCTAGISGNLLTHHEEITSNYSVFVYVFVIYYLLAIWLERMRSDIIVPFYL